MSEKIATREAYGKALVDLGEQNKKVVVLDADLAGATMTKYFKAALVACLPQFHREDLLRPRRCVRGRGWRQSPVHRGHRPHARDPRHDRHRPR